MLDAHFADIVEIFDVVAHGSVRHFLQLSADLMSLFGAKWSITRVMRAFLSVSENPAFQIR